MDEKSLLQKKNVIGWYYGTDSVKGKCLKVIVHEKQSEEVLNTKDIVPKTLWKWLPIPKRVKTDVVQHKMPKALNQPKITSSNVYRTKTRPFQPGQSISNQFVPNAGTLGLICGRKRYAFKLKDQEYTLPESLTGWFSDEVLDKFFIKNVLGDELVGVTNHHVATTIAPVVQPGKLDWVYGDGSNNIIGHVIDTSDPENDSLDVSIIRFTQEVFDKKWAKQEVLNIGLPTGFCTAQDYKKRYVQKSGRTSGLTGAMVKGFGVNIIVDYGDKQILMKDLILISEVTTPGTPGTALLQPGDSGSIILTQDKKVFGLGFAANDVESFVLDWRKIVERFSLIC